MKVAEQEGDPCKQAFLSEVTQEPFIPGSFKDLCVFQVALEKKKRKRFKGLTKRCFSENEKRRGAHFKEGNKSAGQNYQSGKLQHFLQSLECPLLARVVLPPFLEVSCDVKTQACGAGRRLGGGR